MFCSLFMFHIFLFFTICLFFTIVFVFHICFVFVFSCFCLFTVYIVFSFASLFFLCLFCFSKKTANVNLRCSRIVEIGFAFLLVKACQIYSQICQEPPQG